MLVEMMGLGVLVWRAIWLVKCGWQLGDSYAPSPSPAAGGKEDEVAKVGFKRYSKVWSSTFPALTGKKRVAVIRTAGGRAGGRACWVRAFYVYAHARVAELMCGPGAACCEAANVGRQRLAGGCWEGRLLGALPCGPGAAACRSSLP